VQIRSGSYVPYFCILLYIYMMDGGTGGDCVWKEKEKKREMKTELKLTPTRYQNEPRT